MLAGVMFVSQFIQLVSFDLCAGDIRCSLGIHEQGND